MSPASAVKRPGKPARELSSVGAVVVNHDAGAALLACVQSLRAAGVQEIVVVDNASSDASLELLSQADKQVVIVPTGSNLGYGSAANRGVARLDRPLVLICNPDLVLEADAVALLSECLERDEELGAVGPRLINSDGSPYHSARAFPSYGVAIGHALFGMLNPDNRWSRRYKMAGEPPEAERDTDWLSGACLLVRRIAFDSVRGFDEAYFMYVEDLDLCWRLGRAGWRVRFVPEARVLHLQGVSTARHPIKMQIAHHRSTWRFALRSSSGAERLALPLIAAGLVARLALAILHDKAHRGEASVA